MPFDFDMDSISPVESGGVTPSGGKYQLLQRISDDNGEEIGTVSGFFTDANGVEYAVVCLDAQYRAEGFTWCSVAESVTDLPIYNDVQWGPWEAKETATENTQLILDFCDANGYTSEACDICRSSQFIIEENTYYGQLPNMIELNDIVRNHTALYAVDPTVGGNSSLDFSTGSRFWSSSQFSEEAAWHASTEGFMVDSYKYDSLNIVPVLELPNR